MAKRTVTDEGKIELEIEGIKVHVFPDIADNYDLFRLMPGVDVGDVSDTVAALRLMFGDGHDAIVEELRDGRGITKTSDMGKLFFGVLAELSKN